MGYLWTKYLKLRFLGLLPLFPDLTRWLRTAALNVSRWMVLTLLGYQSHLVCLRVAYSGLSVFAVPERSPGCCQQFHVYSALR